MNVMPVVWGYDEKFDSEIRVVNSERQDTQWSLNTTLFALNRVITAWTVWRRADVHISVTSPPQSDEPTDVAKGARYGWKVAHSLRHSSAV